MTHALRLRLWFPPKHSGGVNFFAHFCSSKSPCKLLLMPAIHATELEVVAARQHRLATNHSCGPTRNGMINGYHKVYTMHCDGGHKIRNEATATVIKGNQVRTEDMLHISTCEQAAPEKITGHRRTLCASTIRHNISGALPEG